MHLLPCVGEAVNLGVAGQSIPLSCDCQVFRRHRMVKSFIQAALLVWCSSSRYDTERMCTPLPNHIHLTDKGVNYLSSKMYMSVCSCSSPSFHIIVPLPNPPALITTGTPQPPHYSYSQSLRGLLNTPQAIYTPLNNSSMPEGC